MKIAQSYYELNINKETEQIYSLVADTLHFVDNLK